MIELYQGDCLEVMEQFEDGIIDLTVTSPPYNMNLRIRNGKYCNRSVDQSDLSTKYRNFDDCMSMDEYFEFSKNVINNLLRISKLTFYNVQFLTGNKVALFRLFGEFSKQIKEVIIWDKINAEPAIGEGVLNSQYEVIIVLDSENSISRQFKQANFKRGEIPNLWKIRRGKKYCSTHGAVFPESLADIVINNFSSDGDTVFDPFLGTGTTGVAAKKNGRSFIGIEKDPEYFKIAENRIKHAEHQLTF